MCSIVEPRRVTVSCKHIFSSRINEYSIKTSSFRSTKRRFNDNNISNSKVFHIETNFFSNNDKLLRTSSLNPHSSSFYSNHHAR